MNLLIAAGLVGPHEKLQTYGASDVLAGCIVLFLIFLVWA